MIWRARDGKEEHGTLEVFQTADIHIVDDEVVLSDADSGRCHEGRQFGRRGLFDPQVSGPEFPRGDRFERGKSPPLSLSAHICSLLPTIT